MFKFQTNTQILIRGVFPIILSDLQDSGKGRAPEKRRISEMVDFFLGIQYQSVAA